MLTQEAEVVEVLVISENSVSGSLGYCCVVSMHHESVWLSRANEIKTMILITHSLSKILAKLVNSSGRILQSMQAKIQTILVSIVGNTTF